jgi:hypothetical protein
MGQATREERICKNCNLNEIGDEYHLFLKCTANHSLRNNSFNKIILNKPDFIEILFYCKYSNCS